jgi:hypothetical protein
VEGDGENEEFPSYSSLFLIWKRMRNKDKTSKKKEEEWRERIGR